MGEEFRSGAFHPRQPLSRTLLPRAQTLALVARPPDQEGIHPAQRLGQCRFVVVAVVVDPAAEEWIVLPRQIIQGHVAPMVEFPALADAPCTWWPSTRCRSTVAASSPPCAIAAITGRSRTAPTSPPQHLGSAGSPWTYASRTPWPATARRCWTASPAPCGSTATASPPPGGAASPTHSAR